MTHATSHAPAKPFRHHLVALCCLALLAACDFGGGSGGDGSDTVVTAAPAISQHPVDVQVVAGGSAQFSVVAAGDGLVYQWQRSADGGATWAAVAGAAASTLATGALTQADDGQLFRVVVSSGAASTVSSAARLQVSAVASAPAITAAPSAQQAVAGGGASFAVTASGTDLAYQWQRSTDDGATWADIAGATAPTLHLTELAASADGQLVRAVVSNSAGSLATDAVRLTVQAAGAEPVIGTQPTAVAVVAPQPATFTVAASGQPAPSYQWQRSTDGGATWADIAGATAASYNTGATSLGDNGVLVRVRVSNSAGSVTSEARQLGVSAAASAPAVGQQPQDASVAAGQVVTLSAAVTGTPTPTLQWQLSTDGGTTWVNLNGATGSSYGFAAAASDNGRQYRLVASNSAGTVASRAAVLTVTAATSVLADRAWMAGQRWVGPDNTLTRSTTPVSRIDDQGRVVTLIHRSVNNVMQVFAVRSTPGSAGQPGSVGTAVQIDQGVATPDMWLATAPGGNAVAAWVQQVREVCANPRDVQCDTVYTIYSARYQSATDRWDAPLPLIEMTNVRQLQLAANDVGDTAAAIIGARTGEAVVLWRAAGQANWQGQRYATDTTYGSFTPAALNLDAAGRFTLAGAGAPTNSAGTPGIAVARGSVADGIGALQIVSEGGATASTEFRNLFGNSAGQQVVMWTQLGADRATLWAAALDTPAGSWRVTNLGDDQPNVVGGLAEDGSFQWYSPSYRCKVQRRVAGTWGAVMPLPAAVCNDDAKVAVARNGNLLTLRTASGSAGQWATYDPRLQQLAHGPASTPAAADYLLGVQYALDGTLLLSNAGIGAFVSLNNFGTLPSPARPSGELAGRSVYNLWGLFLQ